jgi:class 3 adenylate cyclase/predicted ATPase
VRCPSCGGETPAGKAFCADCGRPLGLPRCSACGAELLPGKAFCADCGHPVTAPAAGTVGRRVAPAPATVGPAPAAAPAAGELPVAERRICSVLFVDLVGFTPLVERRDPEEVREVLSAYFARAQTIVGHYGGTVEKFIGDAVMAVWGAPVANEDDAERAVRAALDLVAAVAELGQSASVPGLRARGGVVTGEVATTFGTASEGMVLGDAVNSASRIQGAAEPSSVLVDEATWRAAAGAIAFAEVGALTLKGKEQAVRAWRALRVVAQRRGVGRSEGLEPPFVGRDGELRLVKELFHATVDERRARLVSVTGVPGIGKSRLAWEFLKYVDGLADEVHWHQGRSPAYGEGVTFWALGEMVRSRARITEAENPASARAKLADTVAALIPDADERRWIELRLAHLLGLGEAPPGSREELFSAWRTFFERIADLAPAVLVFEDLQWADPGLVDFVESILEWSSRHAIFVLTLARPELVDRRPTWGAGQRSFTSVHLEALGDDQMRTLIDGFVHGLPDAVAGEILRRSEGVPLYAVEIVRSLVAEGALTESDGAYTVTGDLAAFHLPDTLQALIGSRLDSLPAEQRSLLQDAAVVGTTFTADALAALLDVEPAKLDSDLRDLIRKEFLTLDSNPLSPERGQYGFVQALIREVALARLAHRERSAKHLAVARYYEALDDPELAAAVAGHYLEASRHAPSGPQGEAAARDARDWLGRAATRALSLGSTEQAEALFAQSLELTPAGPERAPLLEQAAEASKRAGHWEPTIHLLEEAIALHEAEGRTEQAAHVAAELSEALVSARRIREGIELADRWLAAEGLSDHARAELATMSAMGRSITGREGVLEHAETALTLAERTDDDVLLGRALAARAEGLFQVGRHREATLLQRAITSLVESAGALREQAMSLLLLSVYQLGDDLVASADIARKAAELARRAGDRHSEGMNLLNAAETTVYTGHWDTTRAAFEQLAERELGREFSVWLDVLRGLLEAFTADPAAGMARMDRYAGEIDTSEFLTQRTTWMNARAMASLAAGDLEDARRRAVAAAEADPHGINTPFAIATWGRACLWQDDAAGARAAVAAGSGYHGRIMAALRTTVRAGLAALDGDVASAVAGYDEAFAAWAALQCLLPLQLARLDAVRLLGAEQAPGALEDARRELGEMRAAPWLALLPDEV